MITDQLLREMIPECRNPKEFAEALSVFLTRYQINTPLRIAHFLAQCAHESGSFNILQENLNYSKEGLLKVFPKYFNESTAAAAARKPEVIANVVYANRMGNGPKESGDGWKFRGRGIVQITSRSNYTAFSKDTGMDVLTNPDYLTTPLGAVHSACWFWDKNKLNVLADRDDVLSVTKRINGGTHGLADRKSRLGRYKRFLNVSS